MVRGAEGSSSVHSEGGGQPAGGEERWVRRGASERESERSRRTEVREEQLDVYWEGRGRMEGVV